MKSISEESLRATGWKNIEGLTECNCRLLSTQLESVTDYVSMLRDENEGLKKELREAMDRLNTREK